MSGRPKTSGRFATRRELLERVRFLWEDTTCNQATIARVCRVSDGTISIIIRDQEWKKSDDWMWLDAGDFAVATDAKYFDDTPEVDPALYFEVDHPRVDDQHCGSGYDFGLYPLHIPDRIKRDLELI